MSIFQSLGQRQTSPMQMNPMQMLQQLQHNPGDFLRQAGLNVPAGMNDPQQIISHLMQSGQVSQGRYQQAIQMMQGMGKR